MTANACTPNEDSQRLVEPLLEQVDCQVAYYVEQTYSSLFGPFGFLEPVLTGALTLYVAFYGYQLIVGRGSLSLSGLAPKVLTIGLVLAFATRWGAYQALFLNIFYGGADQLAALMMSGSNGTYGAGNISAIARLDGVLQEIIRIASEWNQTAITGPAHAPLGPTADALQQAQGEQQSIPRTGGAVNLLWFSAILLALSTVGILIIAKVLLGLLLAVGPVLVVLALFHTTRGLFEGWLKTLALYALVAAFATVLAGGVLYLIEPMVARISELRASGFANPQPVFVLAVTVFVFSLLMLQLLRMCGRLTDAWRLTTNSESQTKMALPDPAINPNASPAGMGRRVADMIVAVERGAMMGNDNRTGTIAAAAQYAAPAQNISATVLSRRTNQHYQSFGARLGARGRFA